MDFNPPDFEPSDWEADLAELRVTPLLGLDVLAAARFFPTARFFEPLFCEPWAALVVNVYPIFCPRF